MPPNDAILALPESQRRQMLDQARNNVFSHYRGPNDETTLTDMDRRMHEHFGLEMDTEDYWRPRTPAEQRAYDQKLGDFQSRLDSETNKYPSEETRRRWQQEEEGPDDWAATDDDPGLEEGDTFAIEDNDAPLEEGDTFAIDEGGPEADPDAPTDEDPEATATKSKCPGGNCDPSMGDIAVEFGIGVVEGLVPHDLVGIAMFGVGLALSTTPLGAAVVLGVGIGMLANGAYDLWNNWNTLDPMKRARGSGQLLGGILPFIWGGLRGRKPAEKPPEIPEKPPEIPEKPPEIPEKPPEIPEKPPESEGHQPPHEEPTDGSGGGKTKLEGPYRHTPKNSENGKWVSGERGDGVYQTTDPKVIDAVAKPGEPRPTHVDITYENGFPKFDPYVRDVGGVRGQVDINLNTNPAIGRGGRSTQDFRVADAAYAEKLNAANVPSPSGRPWTGPAVDKMRTEQGLVWHHHENMTTMQLVPQEVNGVSHMGGRALMDQAQNPPLPRLKPPK